MNDFLSLLKMNQLVYITYVQKKQGPSTCYGRIISINNESKHLLVYDDDRKKILHLNVSEIDNIQLISDDAGNN